MDCDYYFELYPINKRRKIGNCGGKSSMLIAVVEKRNELSLAVHSIDRILQKFEYLKRPFAMNEFSKCTHNSFVIMNNKIKALVQNNLKQILK